MQQCVSSREYERWLWIQPGHQLWEAVHGACHHFSPQCQLQPQLPEHKKLALKHNYTNWWSHDFFEIKQNIIEWCETRKVHGFGNGKQLPINENTSFQIKEYKTDLQASSLELFFCSMIRLLQNHGKVNDHCES